MSNDNRLYLYMAWYTTPNDITFAPVADPILTATTSQGFHVWSENPDNRQRHAFQNICLSTHLLDLGNQVHDCNHFFRRGTTILDTTWFTDTQSSTTQVETLRNSRTTLFLFNPSLDERTRQECMNQLTIEDITALRTREQTEVWSKKWEQVSCTRQWAPVEGVNVFDFEELQKMLNWPSE